MGSENPNPHPIRHIAVFAFPFGSHAGPLLSLVRSLSVAVAVAGEVKFSFLSTSRSNKTLFSSDEGFDNVRPYDVDDGWPEGHALSGNPVEPVEMFLRAAPGNFRKILGKAEQERGIKIWCLVSDAFFWFAGEIAGERGVPWLPLWTAGPRSLLLHLETDEIRRHLGEDQGGLCNDKTLDFLPGFKAIRISDLEGVLITSQDSESSLVVDMLHKMGLNLPKATAVLVNSFHKIDPEISNHLKTKLKKLLNIGPFTLTMKLSPQPKPFLDENGCLDWLSEHETASVVYVSFGSVVTPPPHEIAALAEALEEAGIPFLWSFRGKLEGFREEKLCNISSLKGKLVPWAPQVEVLKHSSVGAFVTHCGWNSVLESVVGGVPLICRPFFADQRLNMRTVEAVWGVGVEVDGGVMTKEGIVEALRRVFLDNEGKEMRERIAVLKKLAHEAVDAGGSYSEDFNDLVKIVTQSVGSNVINLRL
ncbi:Flavonoid 3-O-glucosyltransferase [Morus notabilis]|uniref:Glycosyltransferase n=1 Tax=Morus notabilis TaxID=981085 RepID=W9RJL6_9ROSA|nr:Flavonoid 3-O-glucosyltransferase [Morus notabilis]